MSTTEPGSDAWLNQVTEEIIEPERPIIDPHHHLWRKRFNRDYLLPELWRDTNSGHNIEKTLFMECRAFYRRDGDDHLRSLGETETITNIALESQANKEGHAKIEGIIGHVDLRLAEESEEKLIQLLEQHKQTSQGLFKGVRQAGAFDKRPEDLLISGIAPEYLYGQEAFRKGLRVLAEQGFSYDTWHYHHQNEDYLELARAVPECTMILDHFGTPLGVGIYRGARDEIFQQWKQDVAAIAKCENVYVKLGGLAMPDNGFDWHLAERPPTSDEFVAAQRDYYLHMIDCFGPNRCMFESNFPVDRLSLSYQVVWNGFKKMVADFGEAEKHAMFYGVAEKVYRLA